MRLIAGLILWLSLGLGALAQETNSGPWADWDAEADQAREVIDAGEASPEALEQLRKRLEDQRSGANEIAGAASTLIGQLTKEIDALGPPPGEGETEAPEAADLRAKLNERLAIARADQGRGQRAIARVRNLLADLAKLGQRNFLSRLESRQPSALNPANWIEAQSALSEMGGKLSREFARALETPSERQLLISRAPIALLALGAGLFILFGVRGMALGFFMRGVGPTSARGRRLMLGVGATAARVLTAAVAAGLILYGVGASGFLGTVGDALLRNTAEGVAIVIIAYALAAAMFSPESSGLRLLKLDDAAARSAFRATMAAAVVIGVDEALIAGFEALDASDAAMAVLTLLTVFSGALALYRLTLALNVRSVEPSETTLSLQVYRILRRTVIAVCFIAPMLALFGFSFAARFLFFPTAHSLAVIAIAYLIFALVREAVDIYLSLDENRGERLRLIPVLAGFLLFCLTIPVLALVWGASVLDINAAYQAAAEGLVVGDVALSPIDVVTFALVFGVGFTLTRAAQRVLQGSVLPRTGMSEGGASALVSGIGYVGVFLAALVAISATGIDLSNLAIVFGALSVGIGFGLQNIVNNFVSGVILLVERPIKVGDWIDVGGAQGYVKKVNVRSTEIETFDRASYIVPNSDLISSPVLNWTHSNKVGRVRVPVGVAYGTDTKQVEAILLEIGKEHPMVINAPAPAVYFMNFGADSLEFELRVYLRDVNWMLSVKSDLNYKVAERFAEAGIEIPFAQRDLHIRNPEALGQALRGEPS
ncbi:MAG: mechanosensitive ion channel domain-containing protein [Pseudomonadota bacterium]